jgi:hypothetical protein
VTDLPSDDRVVVLLHDAINGKASQIDELRRAPQEQLHKAGQALGGQLTFGRPTVLQILRDWRDGQLTDDQVRCWALLMFHGAFPDDGRPPGWRAHSRGKRLNVDYSSDEAVNEVVFDLKDRGDFDNYGWSAADRDQAIQQLSDS